MARVRLRLRRQNLKTGLRTEITNAHSDYALAMKSLEFNLGTILKCFEAPKFQFEHRRAVYRRGLHFFRRDSIQVGSQKIPHFISDAPFDTNSSAFLPTKKEIRKMPVEQLKKIVEQFPYLEHAYSAAKKTLTDYETVTKKSAHVILPEEHQDPLHDAWRLLTVKHLFEEELERRKKRGETT